MTSGRGLELGRRWYEGRLAPDWRPFDVTEKAAILRGLGLTDRFWNLEQGV